MRPEKWENWKGQYFYKNDFVISPVLRLTRCPLPRQLKEQFSCFFFNFFFKYHFREYYQDISVSLQWEFYQHSDMIEKKITIRLSNRDFFRLNINDPIIFFILLRRRFTYDISLIVDSKKKKKKKRKKSIKV